MASRARLPREVFLSHASRDRKTADAIAAGLRAHGIAVWYSRSHLRGAQQWHDEIGRALRRCDWFVVLVSPAAVGSRWVRRELIYALNSDQYEARIVPVLLRRCRPSDLSWTLDALQRIDFTRGVEAGLRELLSLWRVRFDGRKLPEARRGKGGRGPGR